jgi:hypothetical protein
MSGMPNQIFAVMRLALGLAFANHLTIADAADSADAPLHCEILSSTTNGMATLEGVIHADFDTRGTYSFRVASAGSSGGSNIQQGGGFVVGPEGSATLGRIMLGGNAIYDATLEVAADGMTVTCTEHIGGNL